MKKKPAPAKPVEPPKPVPAEEGIPHHKVCEGVLGSRGGLWEVWVPQCAVPVPGQGRAVRLYEEGMPGMPGEWGGVMNLYQTDVRSYTDEEIKALMKEIEDAGVLQDDQWDWEEETWEPSIFKVFDFHNNQW